MGLGRGFMCGIDGWVDGWVMVKWKKKKREYAESYM